MHKRLLGYLISFVVGGYLLFSVALVGNAAPPSSAANFMPQGTMTSLGLKLLLSDGPDGTDSRARLSSSAGSTTDRAIWVVCPTGGFPATSAVPPPGCEMAGTDTSGTPVGNTGNEAYEVLWNIPASLDATTSDVASYHCAGAPTESEPGGNCLREVESNVRIDDGATAGSEQTATFTEYCVDANRDGDCIDSGDVPNRPLSHGTVLPNLSQHSSGQFIVGVSSSSSIGNMSMCMDFNASGGSPPNSCDSAAFDSARRSARPVAQAEEGNFYFFPVSPPNNAQMAFFLHPNNSGTGQCSGFPGCLMDVISVITTDVVPSPSPSASASPSPSPSVTPSPDVVINDVVQVAEIKGACGCSNPAPGGIMIATEEVCPKCETIGDFGGIVQDSGPNSVLLHSGEFHLREVDLSIPGRGFDWQLSRTYRSGITHEGPLGHNWELNYDRRLVTVTEENKDLIGDSFGEIQPGDVIRMDGDGRADLYAVDGGEFDAPTGFYTELTESNNGSLTERDPVGTTVRYTKPDPSGNSNMSSISDRYGNTMRFEYDASGRLTRVLDTYGRPIDYVYDEDGHLNEVTDFSGRTIELDYNAAGDLVGVTSPSVENTVTGNDFPQGRTTRYTYSSGGPDPTLEHDLLTLTAPNEVAASGPARLQLTYDAQGRVTGQTLGGTNASGIPAGGPIAYQYSSNKTTVTDRNGNTTEYEFNAAGNILVMREVTNRNVRAGDPDSYATTYEYNAEGELTKQIFPEGNSVTYTYDSGASDPSSRGNLLAEIRSADPDRGGDQAELRTTYTYEPIYNQVRTMTEPRGNDPSYVPQNGGTRSARRYTTTYTFDYQEGENFKGLGKVLGISQSAARKRLAAAKVAMGLGDINGDGNSSLIDGRVIRTQSPTVTLLKACQKDHLTAANTSCSLQARAEGTTKQQIVETQAFNRFGQPIRRTDPEDNVTTFSYYPDNDPDGDGTITPGVGSGGTGYTKLVTIDAVGGKTRNSRTNPSPTKIRTQFLYDDVGNLTRTIDGRGVATDYDFNEMNELVQLTQASAHGAFAPAPAEPVELTDFAFLKRFFYDHNGNLVVYQVEDRGDTSEVDGNPAPADLPAGITPDPIGGPTFADTFYEYDILDNRTESLQEVSNGGTPRFLRTRFRYDRNGNRALVIQPVGNARSVTYDERDLRHILTAGASVAPSGARLAPSDPATFVVRGGAASTKTFGYDANGNLILLIDSGDTDGSAANNSAGGDRTRSVYDGFDRRTSVVNAVGTQTVWQYDPSDNVVRITAFGDTGGASPSADGPDPLPRPVSDLGVIDASALVGDTLLDSQATSYDELSRVILTDRGLFVAEPGTRSTDVADGATDIGKLDLTPGDTCSVPGAPVPASGYLGCVSSRMEYDRNSRPTFKVDDDGDVSRVTYDGAGRVLSEIDPAGNETRTSYDDAGNPIETLDIDRAQVKSVAPERFITTNFYDSLGRLQRMVDNVGNSFEYRWDSRSNLAASADAEGPAGDTISRRSFAPGPLTVDTTNAPGNVTVFDYDGVSRRTSIITALTATRRGDGIHPGATLVGERNLPPVDATQGGGDGKITMRTEWDDNSLVASKIDDNGNKTTFTYDDLNRRLTETKGACVAPSLAPVCEPPTTTTFTYDADGNLTRVIDENATNRTCKFDAVNRPTECTVLPGPGVVGTTQTARQYDGLGRVTRLADNNGAGADDDSTLTFAYDSLGRVIEELQSLGDAAPAAVSNSWRAEGLRSELVYPNERKVAFTYDARDRIRTIRDDGSSVHLADYSYIGPWRILERVHPINGTSLSFLNNARTRDQGYDGLGRPRQVRHLRSDGSLIAGFETTFDRMSDRLSEKKLHALSESELYGYDSGNRLISFERGTLDPSATTVTTPSTEVPIDKTWTLDGVGNWLEVDQEDRRHTSLNELIERKAQVTTPLTYDSNGNLTDDGEHLFTWDYKNRLRRVSSKTSGNVIATYTYDGLGRRVRRVIAAGQPSEGTTDFYLDGWREIEEQGPEGALRQFVYGNHIDELVATDVDADGDGTALGTQDDRYVVHQNAVFSVAALTDRSGDTAEGFTYDAYGTRLAYAPGPNGAVDFGGDDIVSRNASSTDNPIGFLGRRHDMESGLVYFRMRHLDPTAGRFIERDPGGIWDDQAGLGNGYAFVGNDPLTSSDPFGLTRVDMYFSNHNLGRWAIGHGFSSIAEIAGIVNLELRKPFDRQGYCKDCLRELGIRNHGAGSGYFVIEGEESVAPAAKHAVWGGDLDKHFAAIGKYFCDDGYIKLDICEAGSGGTPSDITLQALADLTGVPASGPDGQVSMCRVAVSGLLTSWKTARPTSWGTGAPTTSVWKPGPESRPPPPPPPPPYVPNLVWVTPGGPPVSPR